MHDALDHLPEDREEERLRFTVLRAVADSAGRTTGRPVAAEPVVRSLQESQLAFFRVVGFLCVRGYLAYDEDGSTLRLTEKGARYLAPGQRRHTVRREPLPD